MNFWWFDGRDLSDAVKYPADSYDKIVKKAVTLELQSNPVPATSGTTSGIISGTLALTAAILATMF